VFSLGAFSAGEQGVIAGMELGREEYGRENF